VPDAENRSPTLPADDPSAIDRPAFGCLVEHSDTRVVVTMHGELDLASTAELQLKLLALLALPITHLTIDLSRVEFIDTVGLSVLVRVNRTAADRNVELTVEEPSPHVEWLLALTGLTPLAAPSVAG
jgi:anti-sigma B factor antagonist